MGTSHLLRLLSLFTGISVLQQAKSWTISLPKTVTAMEGSCVVVPCQTQPHQRVIWYQYHKIKYPVVYDGRQPHTVEHQFRGRTAVLGKADEGNCTLMIDSLRKADDHLKMYVWINPDTEKNQKFYDQTVTIFVVGRNNPIISIQKEIVEGEMFQVNCSIIYSCPVSPPSLHWDITMLPENYTSVDFIKKVQGQWFYKKSLHGMATFLMHKSRIRCFAKFRTFTEESQQITLNILYKPVTVSLEMEKEVVVEGGSVSMECAANSNPPPHTYWWFRRQLGQNKNITSTQSKMSFSNITRDTSLSCMAHNNLGVQQSNWVDLDVQYPPVIIPESSCHLKENILQCVCLAEASPNASIYWITDGNYTIVSSFTSVSTKKNTVSEEIRIPAKSQTNVSCTALNPLGNDTKQLSTGNLQTSYSWLLWFMFLGITLLLGCALFIYRKYPTNWSHNLRVDVQLEQRNTCQSLVRSQNEDTQLDLQRPERNPDMERLSTVYDNDFLEDMQRSPRGQNRQATAQGVHFNMKNYLNC